MTNICFPKNEGYLQQHHVHILQRLPVKLRNLFVITHPSLIATEQKSAIKTLQVSICHYKAIHSTTKPLILSFDFFSSDCKKNIHKSLCGFN